MLKICYCVATCIFCIELSMLHSYTETFITLLL
uniref:Uncharacterized protein n=1 Tax=Arundo donax TaxID=35708 RepID=A0A0A9FLZ4_ARUDO